MRARKARVQLRGLLVLLLCGAVLVGCSGIVSRDSSGQFGPSWEAREARETTYFQEGDDLGDRARRAETAGREGRREGRRAVRTLIWMVVGSIALVLVADEVGKEDDLTFDAPSESGASLAARGRSGFVARGGGPVRRVVLQGTSPRR